MLFPALLSSIPNSELHPNSLFTLYFLKSIYVAFLSPPLPSGESPKPLARLLLIIPVWFLFMYLVSTPLFPLPPHRILPCSLHALFIPCTYHALSFSRHMCPVSPDIIPSARRCDFFWKVSLTSKTGKIFSSGLRLVPPYAFFAAVLSRYSKEKITNSDETLSLSCPVLLLASLFGTPLLGRMRERSLLGAVTGLRQTHQLVRWLWAAFHPWWAASVRRGGSLSKWEN